MKRKTRRLPVTVGEILHCQTLLQERIERAWLPNEEYAVVRRAISRLRRLADGDHNSVAFIDERSLSDVLRAFRVVVEITPITDGLGSQRKQR